MLLKNAEDSEQIHVEQERTLRREILLLKKEIEVLKYECDLDLPTLRHCIIRLLTCHRPAELEQILLVVANMLQFSAEEMDRLKKAMDGKRNSVSIFGYEMEVLPKK